MASSCQPADQQQVSRERVRRETDAAPVVPYAAAKDGTDPGAHRWRAFTLRLPMLPGWRAGRACAPASGTQDDAHVQSGVAPRRSRRIDRRLPLRFVPSKLASPSRPSHSASMGCCCLLTCCCWRAGDARAAGRPERREECQHPRPPALIASAGIFSAVNWPCLICAILEEK